MRVYFAVCWVWFKLELSNLPRFKVYRYIFWRTYGRQHAATIAKRSRRRVVCRSCNREGLILSNAMWSQNEEQIQANWEIWLSKLLTISANYVTTCVIQYFYMQIDTVDIYKGEQTRKKCTELGKVTKNNLGPIYYDRRFLSDVQSMLAYLLVLPGSRARIVRCGGRYDPQLVKRSSEWVSSVNVQQNSNSFKQI